VMILLALLYYVGLSTSAV